MRGEKLSAVPFNFPAKGQLHHSLRDSAMATASSASTLQGIRAACAEINDESAKMRHQVDGWMDGMRKTLEVCGDGGIAHPA